MASFSRIFYKLQSVYIGGVEVKGVQSVGTSSTTNIESFASFGTFNVQTLLQDMDLEITLEAALMSSENSLLGHLGYTGFSTSFFDTAQNVELVYQTGADTDTFASIKLSAIISSYSAQMGTDGPVTESLTMVNSGSTAFTSGAEDSITGPTAAQMCTVIDRPDFTSFDRQYREDCCASDPAVTSPIANVVSWSMSMDASTEKVSVLGQSLPFGKFATFPVETSMEVEHHLSPAAVGIGGFNSGTVETVGGKSSLKDECYNPIVTVTGPKSWALSGARQASISRSGGDVGGGNVSVSESFTGFNDLTHVNTTS
jgi:hypothetical protein